MIVPVPDRDVERDAPEELFEIGLDMTLSPSRAHELRDVQVTRALALILAQHGHRRGIETPAGAGTVEALDAKRVVLATKATKFRLWHIDTRSGRKSLRDGLPSAHVARVIAGRELRDP